jgi:hypothetical protein
MSAALFAAVLGTACAGRSQDDALAARDRTPDIAGRQGSARPGTVPPWLAGRISVMPDGSSPSQPTPQVDPAIWLRADSAVVRLDPGAIPNVPVEVVAALRNRRCKIPQSLGDTMPHNIVSGDLRGDGHTAWAALCSRDLNSTIIVFWAGDTAQVDSIANAPDLTYVGSAREGVVYSRAIGIADSTYIWRMATAFDGPRPPIPTHSGIDDAFVGKASGIWYWDRNAWLRLQGAD